MEVAASLGVADVTVPMVRMSLRIPYFRHLKKTETAVYTEVLFC